MCLLGDEYDFMMKMGWGGDPKSSVVQRTGQFAQELPTLIEQPREADFLGCLLYH